MSYVYLCSNRLGAAVELATQRVPEVYSKLAFNPLCTFISENRTQPPDDWNVSWEKAVRRIAQHGFRGGGFFGGSFTRASLGTKLNTIAIQVSSASSATDITAVLHNYSTIM